MALKLMTETLRRAIIKVLREGYDEALERFKPDKMALYLTPALGEGKVEKSHGFTSPLSQLNWSLIDRCQQSRELVNEPIGGKRVLVFPSATRHSELFPAVFYFEVPERAPIAHDDLLSVESLVKRAAVETALLEKKLIIDKKRVLPAPDQVDTWTGIRRAGLEALDAGVNDMALSFLERARDMAEEWGPCPELITSLDACGEVLRAHQLPAEAGHQFQRGVSVLEQAGLDGDEIAVPLFKNYAALLYEQRQLKDAEEFYRRALDILIGLPETPEGPDILSKLGVIAIEMGDRASAHVWLEQAVQTAERVFGADHPGTAHCRQKFEAFLAT